MHHIGNAVRMTVLGLLAAIGAGTAAQAQDDVYSPDYGQCMDASGGVTFNMIDCMTSELERQDLLLNEHYKQAMTLLSPDRQEALRAAQRQWIGYRDANCEFYMDPEGGTMARLEANACTLEETAERAAELQAIAEMY